MAFVGLVVTDSALQGRPQVSRTLPAKTPMSSHRSPTERHSH